MISRSVNFRKAAIEHYGELRQKSQNFGSSVVFLLELQVTSGEIPKTFGNSESPLTFPYTFGVSTNGHDFENTPLDSPKSDQDLR